MKKLRKESATGPAPVAWQSGQLSAQLNQHIELLRQRLASRYGKDGTNPIHVANIKSFAWIGVYHAYGIKNR